MLKKIKFLTLLVGLISISHALLAQFERKMELDLHFGNQKTASKPVGTPDGDSFEIGSYYNLLGAVDLWYNINREIAVGLNLGATHYSPDLFGDVPEGETSPVLQSYHPTIGLGGKYHFVSKKRFKAYGKIGIHYALHNVLQSDYVLAKVSGSETPVVIVSDYDSNNYTYTSLGGQINVGMKTYFSNSFGMLFEAGYLNNSYYKGLTFTMGFFFDMIKK